MMYKVLKVDQCAVTSFVDLLNLDTGTQDLECFDDSSLRGFEKGLGDFEFMKEGESYHCKMEFFGEFKKEKSDSTTEVTIIETGVNVGNTKYFKVLINSDVYYILESDAENIEVKEKMHYAISRKDLIQVDDVIHADCV